MQTNSIVSSFIIERGVREKRLRKASGLGLGLV